MELARLRSKRTALVAAAVAAVPLALITQSGSAAGTGDHATTFTIVEHPISNKFVDLPPKSKPSAPSVGDEAVFASTLTKDGHPFGTTEAVCVVTTREKDPLLSCTGTFNLPDGTLAAAAGGRLFSTTTVEIAITGGTGRYAAAGGTITSVTQPDGTSVDTVHLLDLGRRH